MNKKPVVIRIYQGDRLVGVKQFTGGQIIFGQPGDVQVPLEGEAVSVLHASIEDRNGSYFVCDLGSTTGTYKNGAQVLEAEIQSGDVLQIADYRIEFFIGPPPPASTATQTKTSSASTRPPTASATSAAQQRPVPPPSSRPSAPKPPPPPTPKVEAASPSSVAAAATVRPSSDVSGSRRRPHTGRKSKKTFAPPSKYNDVRDFIKPSKGTVVEVLVAWRERVIASYHYSGSKTVTIGSRPDNDIVLPVASSKIRKSF